MCIYCGTNNYRKIYENHHGPIPRESDGRKYEIHHIDGDHGNNDPTNLRAVTLQDHYDIHYSQGDYYACYLMSIQRLDKTPEEISELARLNAYKQIENGTNAFTNGTVSRKNSNLQKELVETGAHRFMTRPDGTSLTSDRTERGENPFSRRVDGTSLTSDRTERGENPFSRRPDGSSFTHDKVKNGTHHLLGKNHTAENNPSYDHTIYVFKNKENGEIVSMTQYNFAKTYNLEKSNLNSMIKGNKKSCKGWTLLDIISS